MAKRKNYNVTISDGTRYNHFYFEAKNKKEARRTAEIAHLGSGWQVKDVSIKRK